MALFIFVYNMDTDMDMVQDMDMGKDKGMVVGSNSRSDDLVVNVCKTKHLSNCRSSSSDEALRLTPHKILSLEESLEFLGDDEYLEVTPKNVRIRKKTLDHTIRGREKMRGMQNG